ncbi:hypothetical protein PRUB_a1660 [Pseudoalteromonas rubra]|uniref:Uncharacterized protein n=1 Tax=Pseudoalteromonas rubra TaxID=43658 RepID=A0A8T0CD61_9GAMM|nr:hypothetical protein [Pseudoalteromonas rubra]KAF7788643.1 hypothetical protein PRUB_a1660 [Pseudoalteromonas rubra]
MKLKLNKKSMKQLGGQARSLDGAQTPQVAGGVRYTERDSCNTVAVICDTYHFRSCLC